MSHAGGRTPSRCRTACPATSSAVSSKIAKGTSGWPRPADSIGSESLPVATFSTKQGLPSDAVVSVLAATDGSLWLAAREGLMRWKDGQTTIFRRTSGLPDDATQSLFEDSRGRIWVFTKGGLAYFDGRRFVRRARRAQQGGVLDHGDEAGNLWLSGDAGLTHLRAGRVVEHFPWSTIGDARNKRRSCSPTRAEYGCPSGPTAA